jgi:hypothetical protein
MSVTSIDLLEQLRVALDELEPHLDGRVVDIEMSRLRVLADPVLFRQELASLIRSAVDDAEPAHSITVRVARLGRIAQVEVISERGDGRVSDVIGSMTLPMPEGASSAADA